MPRYSDSVIQKALQLYIDEVPKTDIARMDEMPSRRTITNWAGDGKGLPDDTSCTTWDDYKEEIETTRMLQAAENSRREGREKLADFYDQAVEDLKDAIRVSLQRLKEGNYKATAGDPKKLLATLARLENRGKELDEFQRKFMKAAVYIIRDLTDETTTNLFVAKMQDLRERQLDELDPQGMRKLES